MVKGFNPVCDKGSRILILGTFPGACSLEYRDATSFYEENGLSD